MVMDTDRKYNVVVIFGGRSGEHEVSLRSARSVLSVLDRAKYDIYEIGITHDGRWLAGANVCEALEKDQTGDLRRAYILPDPSDAYVYTARETESGEVLERLTAIDVVFPVLHGTYGEDGTLQGLLELTDVAYVGAGVVGSSVGMDKGVFKDVMRANGIAAVESIIVLRSEIQKDMAEVVQKAERISPYPLFVKPANLGSSVGVTKCRSRSDLAEGLMEAAQYDRRVLIERGVVNAREIEVSVLGNSQPTASLPGEILPGADFYSYEAKYELDTSQLVIPAPLTTEQVENFRSLAVRAFKAVDCAGMARVDFLLDKDTGAIYLNELNTIPGFTKISMYPKLWEASGLPYASLVDRLIELALERKAERDHTVRQYRRSA
jgi:D-alanine-D-alanine ligase